MLKPDISTLRHSCAHVMASAIQKLYGHATQFAIGPSIEDGFYYDMECEHKIIEENFVNIEAEMRLIIAQKYPFSYEEISRSQAEALFKDQKYKLEILHDLPLDVALSTYQIGKFLDLCKGPHIENTQIIPLDSFKILSVAGAYWRGDEKRPMLQRIYATAFYSKEELDEYLLYKQKMEKCDHRYLSKTLDLVSFHEEAGTGLVFWQPYGGRIRLAIEDFWRQEHRKNGYEFIFTPHIGKKILWETSEHLNFYRESMFNPIEVDNDSYFLKPMNCPFHILIYKNGQHSYRNLPYRWAELGTVYRYERTGALHGMSRVRGFTQDDAHIICTPEQVADEIQEIIRFSLFILNTFEFKNISAYLSTRPEQFVGNIEQWDHAELCLKNALAKANLSFEIDSGGGAFYGPKIDFKVKDSMNRQWQLSTIQIDFNLPERFNMIFIDKDGIGKRPFMIHRALLGSLERFFSILLEHFGGALPAWLAPRQVYIVPVSLNFLDYANEILREFQKNFIFCEVDSSNERMNAKIRFATSQKIPYILIVGGRDVEAKTASIRLRNGEKILDSPLNTIIQAIIENIRTRNIQDDIKIP